MNIVVCVKQVVYPGVPFEIDETTGSASQKESTPVYTTNPVDRCALEEAIKLREGFGGQAIVLTVGPQQVKQAIYSCLAGGADKGIHLLADNSIISDPYTTAFALGNAITDLNADVILCGTSSLDEGSAQVPPTLAELLHLPQVTGVVALEVGVDGKHARATRRLERGNREILECPLPAVIAVDTSINKPRYISTHSLKVASAKNIQTHDLGVHGLTSDEGEGVRPLTRVLRMTPPRIRPKRMVAPDSSMSGADRLKFIMSGGIDKKEGDLMEGPVDNLAQKVMKVLQDEGLI